MASSLSCVHQLREALHGCIAPMLKRTDAQAAPTLEAVVLSEKLRGKVIQLFSKFDTNDDGCISMEDAEKFWAKSWARVNAHAMFNEVDDDRNGQVTQSEWLDFWRNVVAQPEYTEEEVEEEVDNMLLHNGSWVDWNDGRTT